MTTILPPPPTGPPSAAAPQPEPSRRRGLRVVADIAWSLGWITTQEILHLARRIVFRLIRRAPVIASGEVIARWNRDEDIPPTMSRALDFAERTFPGFGPGRVFGRQRLTALGGPTFLLSTRPGRESQTVHGLRRRFAIEQMRTGQSMPVGRPFGDLAVCTVPLIVPESCGGIPGNTRNIQTRLRPPTSSGGRGIHVLVIDGAPDLDAIRQAVPGAEATLIGSVQTEDEDLQNKLYKYVQGPHPHMNESTNEWLRGHATAVVTALAHTAPGAVIEVIDVYTASRDEQISAATLILALEAARKVQPHLLNLSFSITDKTERNNVFERQVIGTMLTPLRESCSTAIIASTGNLRAGIDITPMGFPARHESVTAVGACDYTGRPATYSRYGGKIGTDPRAWWLAPGGTEKIPLITVGTRTYHGTSFASPLITGLIATYLSKTGASKPYMAVNDALASSTAKLEIEVSPDPCGHGILLLNILVETSAM